ncbi:MAG: magnesium and cobalt transport protein CorA [Bacteroidales bacterium]|jgi:magnesium transporter|nr:magnesium and cobalt transport protein CorA [Bacteroidales bacterium]MCI2133826.1 magnesium and cobalt transport protein CorA [Bacteroidales bacterium]
MITIFYRLGGKLLMSQSETELSKLSTKDVLWIDILAPTSEEKHSVDDFLGIVIQSRAQAEEIESSSRFSENERAIFANTNFLMPGPEDYTMEAVSFTFVDNCMTTLRDVPLRSFTELQRRIMAMPQGYVSGYSVFASIMDQRIDLDADMIELMTKEISQFSKRINQREDINEDFLLDINQLQENTMIVRENIVDKQRLITNLLKSEKCPDALNKRFGVLLQDITSLINHTNFSFERLEYLQDTVVGLINLDQNNIMKIFTMVSVLLMPPTLVASFYGMNVFLPFGGWRFSWLAIVIFMLILVVFVIYIFKKKKMF